MFENLNQDQKFELVNNMLHKLGENGIHLMNSFLK